MPDITTWATAAYEGKDYIINAGKWVADLFKDGIHAAAYNGDIARLKELFEKNPGLIEKMTEDGKLPIHCAALGGSLPAMRLLIEYGADIREVASDKSTVLHCAVLGGRLNCVEFALEHGIEVDCRNDRESTPLLLAAFFGKSKNILNALILRGADVGAHDIDGDMAIHNVCGGVAHDETYPGDAIELIELLCEAGAPIDGRRNNGDTALHLAAQYGNIELLSALLENGADLNCENIVGSTPLDCVEAALCGKIIELCLSCKEEGILALEDDDGIPDDKLKCATSTLKISLDDDDIVLALLNKTTTGGSGSELLITMKGMMFSDKDTGETRAIQWHVFMDMPVYLISEGESQYDYSISFDEKYECHLGGHESVAVKVRDMLMAIQGYLQESLIDKHENILRMLRDKGGMRGSGELQSPPKLPVYDRKGPTILNHSSADLYDGVNRAGNPSQVTRPTRKCRQCDTEINKGNFCPECGTPIPAEVRCACGETLSDKAKYCPGCGTKRKEWGNTDNGGRQRRNNVTRPEK